MRWAGSHNSSERRTPSIRPFACISIVLSPRIGYSTIPNALGGHCPAHLSAHKSVLPLQINHSSSGMRWAGSHNSSERRTPNIRPFACISTVLSPRIGYSTIPNALVGHCPARSPAHKSVLPLQINHSSSGMHWAGSHNSSERRTPNIRPFARISTALSPRIGYSTIPNALGGHCSAHSPAHKSVLPLQINHSSSGMCSADTAPPICPRTNQSSPSKSTIPLPECAGRAVIIAAKGGHRIFDHSPAYQLPSLPELGIPLFQMRSADTAPAHSPAHKSVLPLQINHSFSGMRSAGRRSSGERRWRSVLLRKIRFARRFG